MEILEEEYFDSPKLRIVTYNLFGDESSVAKEFAEEAISKKIDVIAIQGITKLNCDILFRTFRSNGYSYARFDHISSLKDRTEFEIIFSKVPILKKEFELFSSIGNGPGRGISKYLIEIGSNSSESKWVWVATSQLEPEGSGGGFRKAQIREIDNHLTGLINNKDDISSGVIFAGDTSIPKWQEKSLGAPDRWLDAWREKGTSKTERTNGDDRMDQIWWYSRSNDDNSTTYDIKCIEFGLIYENGIYAIFEICE